MPSWWWWPITICASSKKVSTPIKSPRCSTERQGRSCASRAAGWLRVFVGLHLAEQLLALQIGAFGGVEIAQEGHDIAARHRFAPADLAADLDRKSTRLNSSHIPL